MLEVNEASTTVQEAAHPDAEIIWGVSLDETLGDRVSVTVIATRFEEEEEEEPVREPLRPTYTEPATRPRRTVEQPSRSPLGDFNAGFGNTTPQPVNVEIEIPPWMRSRR